MSAETLAAFVAAGVGAIGATMVGWQSWETKRAADAAKVGVDLSRALSSEAVRGRLDAAGPRITVRVHGGPAWPPREPSAIGIGTPPELVRGTVWRMDGDSGKRIGLLVTGGVITNESDTSVKLEIEGAVAGTEEWWVAASGPTEHVLGFGEKLNFSIWGHLPLVSWIDNWNAHAAGHALPNSFTATIRADDGNDEGIVDEWRVLLTGFPVQPVPNDLAAWDLYGERMTQRPTIEDGDALRVDVSPRVRRYYLSKIAGTELVRPAQVELP